MDIYNICNWLVESFQISIPLCFICTRLTFSFSQDQYQVALQEKRSQIAQAIFKKYLTENVSNSSLIVSNPLHLVVECAQSSVGLLLNIYY